MDCLKEWFTTALDQHLIQYPQYDMHNLIAVQCAFLSYPISPIQRQLLLGEIAVILGSTPHPHYSCPTCRAVVRLRPSENFPLKALVESIAEFQGESVPEQPCRIAMNAFSKFFPDIDRLV